MFREDFYRMLRDDFEQSEREAKGTLPLLCGFIEEEKGQDIRLTVRRDRLRLAEAEDADVRGLRLKDFFSDLADFVSEQAAVVRKCSEREALFRLMGLDETVPLEEAVEKRSGEMDALIEKADEQETEGLAKNLAEAGRILAGLWDGVRRKDPYVALWEVYLDWRLGERTPEEVLGTARSIYQRKYVIDDEGTRRLLKSETKTAAPGEIEEAAKQLASAILKTDAKTFLYDAGFPLLRREKKSKAGSEKKIETAAEREKKIEEEETASDKEKKTARRQDRTMNLICYCEQKGLNLMGKMSDGAGRGSAEIDSDEFKTAAGKLYKNLRNHGRANAYVPLYIDENTGAGIYIIGRDYIPEDSYVTWKVVARQKRYKLKQRISENDLEQFCRHSCYFCYVSGEELIRNSDGLSLVLDIIICDSVSDAVEVYRGEQKDYYGEITPYSIYEDINESPVEGIDERYMHYFLPEEQDADAEAVETLRKMLGLEKEEFQKRPPAGASRAAGRKDFPQGGIYF